jgi:hypothetical protein
MLLSWDFTLNENGTPEKGLSMELLVETEYLAGCRNRIEIPGADSWEQIKEWRIKWGRFHYTLDGETWLEIDMEEEPWEHIDTKRPIGARVLDPETEDVLDADDE